MEFLVLLSDLEVHSNCDRNCVKYPAMREIRLVHHKPCFCVTDTKTKTKKKKEELPDQEHLLESKEQ